MGSNASDDLQESYDLILDGLKKLSSGVISNIMVSKFYKTPAFPIGAGPDFINCALSANTNYLPEDLLNQLHLIEHDLGRTRLKRWAQRTLDIGDNVDGIKCADCDLFNLAQFTEIQPAFERYNVNFKANYDVSDDMSAYVEAKYVNSQGQSIGQPAFFFYDTPNNIKRDNKA